MGLPRTFARSNLQGSNPPNLLCAQSYNVDPLSDDIRRAGKTYELVNPFDPDLPTAVGESHFTPSEQFKSSPSSAGFHASLPLLPRTGLLLHDHGDSRLRHHTRLSSFERPSYPRLVTYVLTCTLAYPFLLLVSLVANNKSIFWARFVVAAGTGALGFGLALNLLEFAKEFLEAATWATVIHLSCAESSNEEAPGIPIRDLARFTQERTSMYTAVWLLMDRFSGWSTSRGARSHYDKRPWSLFIFFYLFLACLCPSLPFLFGRAIIIAPATVQQNDFFDETIVWGDLSIEDIHAVTTLKQTFEQSPQWTLAPFASLTNFPPSVSFEFGNDTVYFAESYTSQLHPDGVAIGTFTLNSTFVDARGSHASQLSAEDSGDVEVELIQFPKWGIRIYCEKLISPQLYMIPVSQDSFTYIFVSDFLLESLFKGLSIPMPALSPANLSVTLSTNDNLPAGVDPSTILVAAKFSNNGVGHSFFSRPISDTEIDNLNGWLQIEVLSIRLNDTFTPDGVFPLKGDAIISPNGTATRIGYDAAVCVEAYEPWIVETYNATGVSPTSIRIVSKGAAIEDDSVTPTGAKRRSRLSIEGANVKRSMNSTGKMNPFIVSHDNSIAQMVKDNARDMSFVPSPLAVSFTDGAGPTGYTSLSASRYAQVRAMADATNVLPFLAGSGALVTRVYPSQILAIAYVDKISMMILTIFVLIVGLIAAICVPRLPLAVPRRGFDLMSWLAVLHGDNLIGQVPILDGMGKKADLETVDTMLGDITVKYEA